MKGLLGMLHPPPPTHVQNYWRRACPSCQPSLFLRLCDDTCWSRILFCATPTHVFDLQVNLIKVTNFDFLCLSFVLKFLRSLYYLMCFFLVWFMFGMIKALFCTRSGCSVVDNARLPIQRPQDRSSASLVFRMSI